MGRGERGEWRDSDGEHEGENVAWDSHDDRHPSPRGPAPALDPSWPVAPYPPYGYPPPQHYYPQYPGVPPPGYQPEPSHEAGRGGRGRPPRLEYNESGGVSLVAERVPPSVNKYEMLHAHFTSLGPIISLQLNHNRHEAVVTYSTMEDAGRALMYPVLQDPDIGLRPWRSKPGQRGPPGSGGDKEKVRDRDRTNSSAHSITVSHSPGGHGKGSGSAVDSRRPPEKPLGNMIMETPHALQQKRKRSDMEDRRKVLLQSLTDQLKTVLTKLNDPKTTDKQRETLQVILTSIREKIAGVTPVPQVRASRPRFGFDSPMASPGPKQPVEAWPSPSPRMAPAPSLVDVLPGATSEPPSEPATPLRSLAEAPEFMSPLPALPPAAATEDEPSAEPEPTALPASVAEPASESFATFMLPAATKPSAEPTSLAAAAPAAAVAAAAMEEPSAASTPPAEATPQ